MFADEVFVFSPKGKVINLPIGAGVIDFAYAIHSAVGNRMMGAKVNNKIVNLEYQLQSGDVVEVLTGNTGGPGRDWMKMAKTNEARNKIKQWFKKERYDENVALGKSDFNRELKRSGIAAQTILSNDVLPAALKQMSFLTIDDMYAAIGYGGTPLYQPFPRRIGADQPSKTGGASRKGRNPEKAAQGHFRGDRRRVGQRTDQVFPLLYACAGGRDRRLRHARLRRVHPPERLRQRPANAACGRAWPVA
jgi:(p)ppGpp synthase/HD superfamily hydrolase